MTFKFKIQIKEITKPPVWRRVLVPSTFTFENFHDVIQDAFGWLNCHLFQFSPKGFALSQIISIPSDNDWRPIDDATEIKLEDVFNKEGQTFTYIYDFGDNWVHEITLESITNDNIKHAECIAGKGACPPEDCGGVWGYAALKEILNNPEHPEYEEMREWLEIEEDEEWDSNCFSLEETQQQMLIDFEEEEEEEEEIKKLPLSSQKPQFNHPEVELFYTVEHDIDRKELHKILALPRKTLIEDMQTMLKDSIEWWHYFEVNGDTEFPLHALYVLSSLRAEEALDTLFLLMSQEEDLLNFWFGDLITEEFWLYLYWMGQNRPDSLKTFLFTPNVYVYVRTAVSDAIMQIALHHPERKQEMVEWYVDAIEHLLDNIKNDEIFDSFFLESLACDLKVIGNMDVLPLIERCLAVEGVDEWETGTIDEIKKALQTDEVEKYYYRTLYATIDELYDEWKKWGTNPYGDDQEFLSDIKANLPQSNYPHFNVPYVAPTKVGRNDPCPCGSGKKYKKCCGQGKG